MRGSNSRPVPASSGLKEPSDVPHVRKLPLLTLLGTGAVLFACGDIFHSTNFESLCDLDAAACAVVPDAATLDADLDGSEDAGPPFPANFCNWDDTTARTNAQTACAWLGACSGPLGSNAFGACFVNAMLAYDCAANPNLQVTGASHVFWDQLWRATSCADVAAAVEPSPPGDTCGVSSYAYIACEVGGNAATRLACGVSEDGGADQGRENCAALGQACTAIGTSAACTGSLGTCGDAGGLFCEGTELHDCQSDGGLDLGVNCANFGAGACSSAGATGACAAVGTGVCAPTSVVSCVGDVASSCPSGVLEQIDCSRVLGTTGSCNATAAGRSWDVARACSVGSCGADSCSGTVLQSCARGASVQIDCAQVGLGSCNLVQISGDPTPHAACSPP